MVYVRSLKHYWFMGRKYLQNKIDVVEIRCWCMREIRSKRWVSRNRSLLPRPRLRGGIDGEDQRLMVGECESEMKLGICQVLLW